MATDMQQLVETMTHLPEEIAAETAEIYTAALRESTDLDAANFTKIHADDLERIFDLYDESFFGGGCRRLLGDTTLGFRLSSRMTRAAGKTTRHMTRRRNRKTVRTEYEIAMSTALLFETFQDETRPITVNGKQCTDRLQALQRVFEHEIVHLIEMLLWKDSSCSAHRFQSIANRFFGHTQHKHHLITPRERALTKYGIKAGDQVSFRLDGQHYVGIVNRITKRATVLVEDRRGTPYTDGRRYAKFYVPLHLLKPVKEE